MGKRKGMIREGVALALSLALFSSGMNLSGNFWMMENIISSNRLWSLWKNSLILLWSLISISI